MKTYKEKILVAADEASIRRILEARLSLIGYDVVTAADGEEALTTFHQVGSDLVVLDVMMPKLDGYSVCKELRQKSSVPIIMLTALVDVADRIAGLNSGADDYLVKPFSPKELEARIRSALRRAERTSSCSIPSSEVAQVGKLRVDTNNRQVQKKSEHIKLTRMEFNLLESLIAHSGEAFSRSKILQEVWGYAPERHADTWVVDIHISRLRAKLEDDPNHPNLILTRGSGYLFQGLVELV